MNLQALGSLFVAFYDSQGHVGSNIPEDAILNINCDYELYFLYIFYEFYASYIGNNWYQLFILCLFKAGCNYYIYTVTNNRIIIE
jgi:hypothetical protein